jgi:cell division protein FtsL
MTIAGIEVDAIYVVMIVSILVVAVSLVGLCRASFMEHRYYRTRGRWHQT